MKFKFRADAEDLLIFIMFAVFLLYIVAISVVNVHTFATEGHLSGLNPFPAFGPKYLFSTIALYFVCLLGLFASVSSMFFDREKGFGLTTDKKDKGYSRWAKDKEIQEELVCIPLTAKNSKAAGIPLMITNKEMWVDNGEYHSLVIGATGSGKTQGVIHPMVHSLCKARESMIITDPKGEIYEGNAEMLRKRGYQILILNFRDPQNGNAWNPMAMPYKLYKEGNHDKAIELLDDLALNILYDDTNKNADPFWEKTSADYFSGVALGLFEDAKEDEININSISLVTTVGEEKFGGSTYIKEYFAGKDPGSAAAINVSSTIMAPSETKGSILSVFKQKVKLFASRDNLSEMLSHSDIDLESIGERPTAVFIIIQDEKKTYHSLVTILLKQIYETLISVAQRHGGQLPIRTNFLLDEFPNMPPLKDVTTMITAARSRKIRFTMIIQNFAQLDSVYGKEDAETIRGNCGNIVYLITTELKALEEISKMCGDVKSKKDEKTDSTPLVTVSDLQRMKQYEVILLRMRKQPFKTKVIPNYKLDWGEKYPIAKYPTRQKQEVHMFDIKEFVRNEKKKKLIEMMNAADEKDRENASVPMPFREENEAANALPPELQAARERRNQDHAIPDFLTRVANAAAAGKERDSMRPEMFGKMETLDDDDSSSPFGRMPSSSGNINPFMGFPPSYKEEAYDEFPEITTPKKEPVPKKPDVEEEDEEEDLGFDVDELVRKIDAKIAELEKEEKENQEKEQEEKKKAELERLPEAPVATVANNSIETIYEEEKPHATEPVPSVVPPTLDLDDDGDDDDFFDDFFDN